MLLKSDINKFKAFSMIEVIIYLFLSNLLAVLMLLIFTNVYADASYWHQHIQLHSNANVVEHMMRYDLRNSGVKKCYFPKKIVLKNDIKNKYNELWKLYPAVEKINQKRWIDSKEIASDVLLFHEWVSTFTLIEKLTHPRGKIRLLGINKKLIKSGQYLLITDCKCADLIQVSNIHYKTTPQATTEISHANAHKISNTYSKSALVGQVAWVAYYLVKDSEFENKQQLYSLYRKTSFHSQQKIIDHVKSFSIKHILHKNYLAITKEFYKIEIELENKGKILTRKILI